MHPLRVPSRENSESRLQRFDSGVSLKGSTQFFRMLGCWLMIHLASFSFGLALAQSAVPRVYRAEIEPHWLADNTRFWYQNDNPSEAREFVLVDAAHGIREPAFDHGDVSRQLGANDDTSLTDVEELKFNDDDKTLTLIGRGKSWELDLVSGHLEELNMELNQGGGLSPLEFLRSSRNGGEETEIVFHNRLQKQVAIFWVDTRGERHAYGVIEPGEQREQHTFAGHVWLVTDEDGNELVAFAGASNEEVAVIDGTIVKPRTRSRRGRSREPNATSVKSPDGKWEAIVKNHRLWIRHLEDQVEVQLSDHGNATNSFHRDAIRSRAVGMRYDQPSFPDSLPDVIWSPDSKKLIAFKTTVVPEPRVNLVVSSPTDQLQPKLDSYPYIKPGDPIPLKQLHVFDIETEREFHLDSALFDNPWDLGRFVWEGDSSRFYFLYNRRGHQVLRFIAVTLGRESGDQADGELTQSGSRSPEAQVEVIVEERAKTFINYSNKTYLNILTETDELIWMSERDGWNHLYLFDLETGEVKNRITQGEWVVRSVDRVDEKSRQIWFRAMGIIPGQDPYFVHYCRIDIDGSDLVILTEADGTHSIQWSPDRRFIVDTWSRVDQPPVHELRDAKDGSLICRLDVADAGEIEAGGYRFPKRFVAKGRDGKTDIHGILHYPRQFDPTRRYPVVENIYAGPHGQHVPKSFRARYRRQQEIADRGFIVVQIDGMGTNWRSKAFHDVAWKNIKDAGFPDRIAWMHAAARSLPWLDISRVGIYGGSAGGQNAMRAVLDHADFYDAAAADCGCHDNRMDKIWWNEAWMGWPVDDSYVKSSNMEDAGKLDGKLLLTVGELDRNVDPSSTYQVVNALKIAGKEFEFMLMIGQGHGAAESDYGRKLRSDFFVRHLIEETP